MTSTPLQATEQGQRLKVMGGLYLEGFLVGRSVGMSFLWGFARINMAQAPESFQGSQQHSTSKVD